MSLLAHVRRESGLVFEVGLHDLGETQLLKLFYHIMEHLQHTDEVHRFLMAAVMQFTNLRNRLRNLIKLLALALSLIHI